MQLAQEKIVQRLIKYAMLDTASDERSAACPSTPGQRRLAELLAAELTGLGLSGVELTEYGYLLAQLPANTAAQQPSIGLIAHLDTSSEASGANVRPQLHRHYDGGALRLNGGTVLAPAEFPELLHYLGQDILTADGTTLLGADDKAGICAIVSACEYLLAHPEIPHGTICLAFTPDEEIGRGTEHFPLERFGAAFAYTVDGGALGELNYETFNACNVQVIFHGVAVHPGSAKNKMRNAISMAAAWQQALPAGERPEYTEGYEGFYHSLRISGGVDRVELEMILRDHDAAKLQRRKDFLLALTEFMNQQYGSGSVECHMQDVYRNMRAYLAPVFGIVERAQKAMLAAGVEPLLVPIRGGTDGARLSEMGLPCPNLFTGGHNFHGRFEYLPVPSLLKSIEVLVRLVAAE